MNARAKQTPPAPLVTAIPATGPSTIKNPGTPGRGRGIGGAAAGAVMGVGEWWANTFTPTGNRYVIVAERIFRGILDLSIVRMVVYLIL